LATDLVGAKGLDLLRWSSRRMLRMPAEEERGGRYITMAEESCGSIGSTRSREAGWIAEDDGG